MFRVTQNTIQQGLSRIKTHLQGAYSTERHWAGMLDRAVSIGRRAYDVVKPLLDQSNLGRQLGGGVAKGLMDYNRIRGDVLSGHDRSHSLLQSLKKAVPEVMF